MNYNNDGYEEVDFSSDVGSKEGPTNISDWKG